jgi:hypothetical protein
VTAASCARCGTAMPAPTGRAARKRYCGDSCRKAAWRDRQRDDAPGDIADIVSNVVPGVVAPGVVVPTLSRNDVTTLGSQHRCPRCRQPLAIISVVIPADAAVVSVPEPPMTPR